MNISPEMIPRSAAAGMELLQLRTTLVPGDLKDQIAVLQAVLMSITTGALVVVPAPKLDVELPPEGTKEPEEPDNARLKKAVATAIEEGRDPIEPSLPGQIAEIPATRGAGRGDSGTGSAASDEGGARL